MRTSAEESDNEGREEMMRKGRRTAKEQAALRDQRAAPAFIKQLRDLGVTLTRCEDGTVEIFSPTPIPALLARFIADFSEEISAALAKEGAPGLSALEKCRDCGQPFQLIGFDASDQEQGEARMWRCNCHMILEQALRIRMRVREEEQ